MDGHIVSKSKAVMLGLLVIPLVFFFTGCKGSDGPAGSTAGAISGTVTTATGAAPLAGVTVSTNPSAGTTTTDGSGNYSMSLPAGTYTITFALTNFTSGTATANVAVGITTPLNATMAEAASGKPTVTVAASGQNVGYGNPVNLTAAATSPNSYALSYTWKQSDSPSGVVSKLTSTTTSATATMQSLASALSGSVATTDPGGYVTKYTQETRFGVLPITADTRGAKSITVTADDGHGGSTAASITVNAAGIQTGVRAVAVGLPVYMNSGIDNDTTTAWTVSGPASSPAYSVSTPLSAGRNPSFTPDVVGKYIVSTGTGTTMTLYAGTYAGAISSGAYVSKTITNTDPKWNGMWITVPSTGSSVTYAKWPVVNPDPGCTGCHDVNSPPFGSNAAPDKFTPWKDTAHATFFARGIENITSNSDSCTTCHTVGYDKAASANNGGYDDQVTATGFKYKKGIGAWGAMSSPTSTSLPVARVSNIQCENCHGPQVTSSDPFADPGAHGTTLSGTNSAETSTTALRVSFSSEVCATCHASGTGHHLYSEWLQLDPDTGFGHSNRATAIADGMSTSCGRCHSAQGYTKYVNNLNAGNIGSLTSAAIDWDATNVQPQTCTACHDPHDATNPNQLRFYDSTPLLPAGFSVTGLGKGALCVSCHNSRNGAQTGSTTLTYLHEDGETYNSGNPTGYSAPHQACQGDVLMGRNAYFMGVGNLPMLSKHANAEDSCVGCHLALNPQTHLSHGSPAVSTHVMYIRDQDKATVCANCHTANTTGEALVANVEAQLALINAQMGKNVISKTTNTVINVIAYNSASDLYSGAPGTTAQSAMNVDLTTGNSIASVVVEEIHGQIGLLITLANPITITWNDGLGTSTSTNTFGVQMGNLKFATAGTPVVYAKSGNMVRAGWNYFLIEGDASKGIHNPSFAQRVLSTTYAIVSNPANNN